MVLVNENRTNTGHGDITIIMNALYNVPYMLLNVNMLRTIPNNKIKLQCVRNLLGIML